MENNIVLETKYLGSISGNFYIKSYQRGYRWREEEVTMLLNDIYYSETKTYWLQPIVVKKENDKYELIDGQQRLTTMFLIYQYIHEKSNHFLNPAKFTIDYETRKQTKEFLTNMNLEEGEKNIDFWHLAQAYKAIDNWFSSKEQYVITKFNEFLNEKVKVIWYEVDSSVNSIELFTRLNIGKIPLTNAELVKAMFLCKDNNKNMTYKMQQEIALQWDNIEKSLHNDRLWFFLTNNFTENYQTRIDLILDLISRKTPENKEKYYTFFKIDEMKKENKIQDIWDKIQQTFLILNDWFNDHEFYHKIGYLIASEYMSLLEIYEMSENQTKKAFLEKIDSKIKESIKSEVNYGEYLYDKDSDKIYRLLLLFNIESVRKNGEETQWFPFNQFKSLNKGKAVWSLEHIHAQHSKNLKTVEQWKEWLKWHYESLISINCDDKKLLEKVKNFLETENISNAEAKFEEIQEEIFSKLSKKTNINRNSIANLAILNLQDNSVLSNSTFDVKRNRIIQMDKSGKYIPFCTRMVFLKYYTPSEENQVHFWGEQDMVEYLNYINKILEYYLDGQKIEINREEDNNE